MKYTGNRLFNGQLFTFCFLGICIWLYFTYNNPNELVDSHPILLGGAVIILGIIIWEAFYFKTTPTQLIAKNYILPFIQFTYDWNEITQVELRDSSRKSMAYGGLKIYRTNGRESSTYYSASLFKKDWHALMLDLKAHHVHIVNSSIKLDKIEMQDYEA